MTRVTPRDRDRALRKLSLLTGGITAGSIALTGLFAVLAADETAQKEAARKTTLVGQTSTPKAQATGTPSSTTAPRDQVPADALREPAPSPDELGSDAPGSVDPGSPASTSPTPLPTGRPSAAPTRRPTSTAATTRPSTVATTRRSSAPVVRKTTTAPAAPSTPKSDPAPQPAPRTEAPAPDPAPAPAPEPAPVQTSETKPAGTSSGS